MADLVIKPAVTKTEVIEISPATYTVTLNENEFVALMVLVGMVGGEPNGTIREVLTPIWDEVFNKEYLNNYCFKSNTFYTKYREQLNGNLYV